MTKIWDILRTPEESERFYPSTYLTKTIPPPRRRMRDVVKHNVFDSIMIGSSIVVVLYGLTIVILFALGVFES
jgi:hypothetical protein